MLLFCEGNNKYLWIDTHINTHINMYEPLHNPQKEFTKILNLLSAGWINRLFWFIRYIFYELLMFLQIECIFYQKRKCYFKKSNLIKGETLSGLFPIMWKLVCVEEADDISTERERWLRHINMYSALVYGTRQKSYCICLKVLVPRPTLTAQRCFP